MDEITRLRAELSAYQQAEMPGETLPFLLGKTEVVLASHYDALRAHLARVTVERNEAKADAAHVRQANENYRIENELAKEAQARAETAQIAIQETCRAQYENYEKHLDEIMQQRDAAEDALQDTHIALGGDGEWSGKLPPESPPNSGDLKAGVPALAKGVLQRAESAERRLAECDKLLTYQQKRLLNAAIAKESGHE